jgi:hypothetical protein
MHGETFQATKEGDRLDDFFKRPFQASIERVLLKAAVKVKLLRRL